MATGRAAIESTADRMLTTWGKLRDHIITLSAGTIVLSVSFLHNFKKELDGDSSEVLATAWVALAVAIFAGLVDGFAQQRILSAVLGAQLGEGEKTKGEAKPWMWTMAVTEFVMVVAFLAGVVCFIVTGCCVLP